MNRISQPPQADGLYDPRYEHDACGVAVVARLDNRPSNEVVQLAIEALANLEHRGAAGADPDTGDGAGILVQMPDALLREVVDFELPPRGRYGVAMCFLPTDPRRAGRADARCSSGPSLDEGQIGARLARGADRRPRHRLDRARLAADDPPALHRRRARRTTLTRTPSSASST